jgi:transcriptional regulator with XRE-family HTH domain
MSPADLLEPIIAAANPASVGRRLKLLRLATSGPRRSTVREFADWCGFSRPAWSNYEIGLRVPKLEEALKLKRKFGVTFDWIYTGDELGMPASLLYQIHEIERRPEFAHPVLLRGKDGRAVA